MKIDRDDLTARYRQLCAHCDGRVLNEDTEYFLGQTGMVRTRAEGRRLILLCDSDRSGVLTDEKFDHMLYIVAMCEVLAGPQLYFYASDRDHSGLVGAVEFVEICRMLGYEISMLKARNLVRRHTGSEEEGLEVDYNTFLDMIDEVCTYI